MIYTTKFGDKIWPDARIGKSECLNSSHCEITYDKNLIDTSHAVLFHARGIRFDDLETYRHLRERFPWQIWVLITLESPMNTRSGVRAITNLFNWTATYHRSSDIVTPYMDVIPIHEKKKIAHIPR